MEKKIVVVGLVLVVSVAFHNCAPARYVKPLAKNEQAAGFSFGGPIIGYAGAAIPLPFTTLSYARGINNELTAFAGLHTTSLAFGNFQTDLGITYGFWKKENMGLSGSIAAQFATGIGKAKSTRLWPSADLNFYYHPKGKNSYAYAGTGSWFEFAKTRAHGVAQETRSMQNMHLGYQFVNQKFSHQLEFQYVGAGRATLPGVVDYKGISGKGAFGFYYGVIRKF
jgi:hypothetical protein